MGVNLEIIKLSKKEYDFLVRAGFFRKYKVNERLNNIGIDRIYSEKCRDFLTNLLAEIGFDEDYNLNACGLLIQNMIDKLFVSGE